MDSNVKLTENMFQKYGQKRRLHAYRRVAVDFCLFYFYSFLSRDRQSRSIILAYHRLYRLIMSNTIK